MFLTLPKDGSQVGSQGQLLTFNLSDTNEKGGASTENKEIVCRTITDSITNVWNRVGASTAFYELTGKRAARRRLPPPDASLLDLTS